MMSTHSSNKETAKETAVTQIWTTIVLSLRKNLAIAVTTFILMLLALPVILLMLPIRQYDSTWIMELFRYLVAIPVFAVSVVVLILSAGQMFSFLHRQNAVDVYHALPVRRATLFLGRFLAGALLVLLPQFLTFVLVILIRFLPGYHILELSTIVQTALSFMLISLALYAAAVLSFVLTGKLFDAMFLLLMLNIAYPGTLYTIDSMLSLVLPGFSMANYVNLINIDRYLLLCPAGELFKVVFQAMNLLEVLWWIVLILVMGLGSLLVYTRRPSEMAGKLLAYRAPFLIIRFLACLVVGLIFGYLYYNLYSTLLAFIFSAAVGSLAAHTLIEVALSRGFRNYRRSLPSYGVFVLLFAISCLIVTTGFFGYDTRLPKEDKIVQVRFETNSAEVYFFENSSDTELVFADQNNIRNLFEMNKTWLNQMKAVISEPYSLKTNRLIVERIGNSYSPYRITYVMPSGVKFVRTVYFNFTEEPYASLYRQIRGTAEYKLQQYKPLFKQDSILKFLSIKNKVGQRIQSLSDDINKEYLAKILAALRQDLLQNAEEKPGSKFLGYLDLTMEIYYSDPINGHGYAQEPRARQFLMTDAYVNTVAVLNENHLLDNLDAVKNQYIAAFITSSNGGGDSLLGKLLLYQNGPYAYPVGSWMDKEWPLLNDKQVFTKIENPDLIRFMYNAGQDVENAKNGGYLVLLAVAGQVEENGTANEPLPVLYLPADQVPQELSGLLK
jgi:hypothetical protein